MEARNGSEALDVVRHRGDEIGAIVTDVIMPVMGGRDLKERVAKLRPTQLGHYQEDTAAS